MKIIDTHCHLHDEKFNADQDQVIQNAFDAGLTHMVTIGCDLITTEKALNLSEKYNNIYFSAGFHPHDAKFMDEESFEKLKEFASHKKCVAIGECGLDFYYNHSDKDEQKQSFIKQIHLAYELNLPLIIHLRDAFSECLEILEENLQESQKVVIHCFSGSLEEATIFSEMGFYISLSGIITFKKPGDLVRVAASLPLEKILIETDAPYLAPHPHRGQRNEPALIKLVLAAVAQARGLSEEKVATQIYENSKDFFGFR